MTKPKVHILAVAVLCVSAPLWFNATARAADHDNLEEGLPTEVEDAYPLSFKAKEFQLQGRYEREDKGNRFTLQPSVEWGFARNWQGKITAPFYFGSADKTGSGNVGVEALYNFNQESLSTPAFALSARADFPTGRDANGVDTTFKFIASKTLGKGQLLQRLHLNLIYRNNASPRAGERSNRYAAIAGYSQRIGPDTMLVADYVYQQELEKGRNSQILELGFRRQLTPLRVFSIGVGAGLNHDAPKVRLTAGFQQTF